MAYKELFMSREAPFIGQYALNFLKLCVFETQFSSVICGGPSSRLLSVLLGSTAQFQTFVRQK